MLSHMDVVNVDMAGAFIDQMTFLLPYPLHKKRLGERIWTRCDKKVFLQHKFAGFGQQS
jgi:hypothetical protein